MRLREITSPNKSVSFALGRLNPATTGHGLLVEAVRQGPGDAILFLTDRPAKLPTDPLNPNEKLDWARKSFPDIKIELAKNIMFGASDLFVRGYRSVTFFEGEDKLGSLLEKYNGQKSAHGFFEFEEIKFERLSRNPDAEDATGMSASKMRQAVITKDFDSFKKGVTKSAQPFAKKMFDNLSTILGSTDENLEELVVKQQKPKLDVLNNIASRKDNKPFPLSWSSDDNEIKVGGKVFVTPQEANRFLRFYDNQEKENQELMQKALRSAKTTVNLFKNLGFKFTAVKESI